MGWVLFWITCGIASAYIASQKNKSGFLWFFLGLIIGPLALIMVGLSPARPEDDGLPGPELRKCPFCAEEIKPEAVLCKHCGKEVEPVPQVSGPQLDISEEFDKIFAKHNGEINEYGMRCELHRLGFSPSAMKEILEAKAAQMDPGK